MTDSQCQICIQFEAEDICILSEMLTQITNPIPGIFIYQIDHKIPTTMFPLIFKNLKFRKCLAQIFDSKYLEICEKCAHNRLSQVFLPLFSNNITEFNEPEITQQIEEGLDKLYESIQEKQTKLKQSKEQFDRLAQQLFNCEDDVNDSDSLGESSSNEEIKKNDDDEQQPIMQFNKNSNKNKFQKRSIDILKKWFLDHLDNPYPDNTEKQRLSKITGMHVRQIQNWFTNSRKRYLEPLKKKFEHGLVKDSESPEEESSKEQKKSKQQPQQQQQVQIPPPQKKVKMEDGPPIKPEQTNVKQEPKQPIQQPVPQMPDINLLQQQQFLQFQQMQQMAQLQQLQWMNPLSQLNPLQFQLAPQFLSQFYNIQDPQKMQQMAGIPPLLQMPQLSMLPQMQPPGLQQFLQANLGQAAAQQAPLPGLQLQIPNMQFLSGQMQQQGNQAMMYQLYQQQLPNDQKKQTQ